MKCPSAGSRLCKSGRGQPGASPPSWPGLTGLTRQSRHRAALRVLDGRIIDKRATWRHFLAIKLGQCPWKFAVNKFCDKLPPWSRCNPIPPPPPTVPPARGHAGQRGPSACAGLRSRFRRRASRSPSSPIPRFSRRAPTMAQTQRPTPSSISARCWKGSRRRAAP